MTNFKSLQVSGWGRYPVAISKIYRPERMKDITEILNKFSTDALISRGYGRSYGDAALNNENSILLTERLNRFLSFDKNTGLLKCEAGLQLKDILDVFVPQGWFLPVTPGTKYPSVGGSFACDVHGKNHHRDGTFSSHVQEIELLLASGEIVSCSSTKNTQLFQATAGGMGLTGIILTVTLKLQRIETAYVAVNYVKTTNLQETMEICETEDDSYHYSVCWIDCLAKGSSLGRAVIMRGEHAIQAQLPVKLRSNPLKVTKKSIVNIPFAFPNWVVNPLLIKMFNSFYYYSFSKDRLNAITNYDSYFYPLDSLLNWNLIYGNRGFVQYQCVLPLETSRVALTKILQILSSEKMASFLAVLKRFGLQEGLLSFPMPGYTLALDIPVSKKLLPTLKKLDDIVVSEGGRIYLGKDACLSAKVFKHMYTKLDEWKAIKDKVDPTHIFSSDLSRRLELTQ